jgi:hypothetical protein
MAALQGDRRSFRIGNTERQFPVAEETVIFQGAMVGIDADNDGLAVPISESSTLECVGVAIRQADNSSGSDGDIQVATEIGIWPMKNSETTDELTLADVGSVVYGVDDQTVAKTDDGGSRPPVGTLWNMDKKTGMPLVKFG